MAAGVGMDQEGSWKHQRLRWFTFKKVLYTRSMVSTGIGMRIHNLALVQMYA